MGRGRVDRLATRDHVDIDIVTFVDDQRAVFEQLSSWNLIAHDAIVDQETKDPWDGRQLVLPAHVHAHSDDLELEVLINERSHDEWVLSDEPPSSYRSRVPLRDRRGGFRRSFPRSSCSTRELRTSVTWR